MKKDAAKNPTSPLMQQYFEIKTQLPDALLFFQVGDFYELFLDDAKQASAFLGITLTKRGTNNGEPIPLCGVPVHAVDHYVTKLVRGGFKVALCDQLEDAKPGSIVRRGVTQVLTPGTLTDSQLLDARSASYLFSFFPLEKSWGLLFGELMTAQLFATVLPSESEKLLDSELTRFFPDEILLPSTPQGKPFERFFKRRNYYTTFVGDEPSGERTVSDAWIAQLQSNARDVVNAHDALRSALHNFHQYMHSTQQASLAQFTQVQLYQPEDFLVLDGATQRNLELIKNSQDGGRANTLFSVLDCAATPMGSRMIKKWLMRPLVKKEMIIQRQDMVAECVNNVALLQQLQELLAGVGDTERVVGRIALSRAKLEDYRALTQTLERLPALRSLFLSLDTQPTHDATLLRQGFQPSLAAIQPTHKATADTVADTVGAQAAGCTTEGKPLFSGIRAGLGNFDHLLILLDASLNSDVQKEWTIKQGFSDRLDAVRDLMENGNTKIIELEQREQAATGINSLKIRYSQAHGYAIEVTNANAHAVPERYVRRQTLVGRERFVTPELLALQYDMTCARADSQALEKELFQTVQREVMSDISALRKLSHTLAYLDALFGLATTAYNNGYVRPTFNENRDILITDGRHPMVEFSQGIGFIPNDTVLTDEQSTWIITGPNMGGKSTYLRQVALMSIMAQCGSFVPARSASLPILDRVFTRIGAGDNVAEGKSTFLVEMEETATICTQATKNSLVILDEVGRGTSTFDGLAIAQAVVENIHQTVQARCLFATHYHELARLAEKLPAIASYYAASKRTDSGIVFLYKMVRGVADGSFGVEVAKLAQLPPSIVARSQEILAILTLQESSRVLSSVNQEEGLGNGTLEQAMRQLKTENARLAQQLAALQAQLAGCDDLAMKLKNVDYDDLSPKKAFDLLWQLKGQS